MPRMWKRLLQGAIGGSIAGVLGQVGTPAPTPAPTRQQPREEPLTLPQAMDFAAAMDLASYSDEADRRHGPGTWTTLRKWSDEQLYRLMESVEKIEEMEGSTEALRWLLTTAVLAEQHRQQRSQQP